MTDVTLFMYVLELVICYSAFVLFGWWAIYKWHKSRCRPTNVYILVMFLFLARAYAIHIGFTARNIGYQTQEYHDFVTSMWWHTRVLPEIIVEFCILWRMARRVALNFFLKDKRRLGDVDGDDV